MKSEDADQRGTAGRRRRRRRLQIWLTKHVQINDAPTAPPQRMLALKLVKAVSAACTTHARQLQRKHARHSKSAGVVASVQQMGLTYEAGELEGCVSAAGAPWEKAPC